MEKEYSEFTYKNKNPLARFSHNKRFSIALKLILELKFDSLLDYGSGDGKLFIELKKKINAAKYYLSGYEPAMEHSEIDGIKFYTELTEIGDRKFDIITCFEVLEHFNEREEREMLSKIFALSKKDTVFIISVPIEIGLPSLVKNIKRLFIKGNLNWHFIKNAIKCLFAMDIPERRNMEGFITPHTGFNYKKLEKLFLEKFEIVSKVYSPFKRMPVTCNSQIFYTLKRRDAPTKYHN